MMREKRCLILGKRARRIVATATALTFLCQNFAWAVCADGSTFPTGGFVPPPSILGNWVQLNADRAAGSIFVPDNSVFEHNDPTQPLTGGGHNWVADSALCKQTDMGPAGGTPTAWAIPPINTAFYSNGCIQLPIIKGGVLVGFGDTPFQGDAITPTCNPALLSQPGAPNPANTRLNQLGCAISHGVATTPQSATTFLFVAGLKSGLFAVPLVNVSNPVSGGDAGKIIAVQYGVGIPLTNYYSSIPDGQRLTNGAVSPDGLFAIASSTRRLRSVYACL